MRPLAASTLAVLPTDMELISQETSRISSNGEEYITKLVYETAYIRLTLKLNEAGEITNRKVDNL